MIPISLSKDKQIICNKVTNRFLNLSESVLSGLEPEPKLTDFEIIKELGSGSFGRVFLATHKVTKVDYAIKAIDKKNKANLEGKPYFRREIEIMYKLFHPNCVRLYGNFEDETNCYFIMEYIANGNLYHKISKERQTGLDNYTVASILYDMISAIHYLHSMSPPIIHRDIKPENVLLTEEGVAKLTDFGWSNYIEFSGEQRSTFCGTPIYLAPEMITNEGHDEHVDIWCLGVLMFEMLTGSPPFYGKDREKLMRNIINININWPKPPKILNEVAKDLILRILKVRPRDRISLEEMVKHPFFIKFCPQKKGVLDVHKNIRLRPFIMSKDKPNDEVLKAENSDEDMEDNDYNTATAELSKNCKNDSDPIISNTYPRKRFKKRDISPILSSKLKLDNIGGVGLDRLKRMEKYIKNNYKNANQSENNLNGGDFEKIKLNEELKIFKEKLHRLSRENLMLKDQLEKEKQKNELASKYLEECKIKINNLSNDNELLKNGIKIKEQEIFRQKEELELLSSNINTSTNASIEASNLNEKSYFYSAKKPIKVNGRAKTPDTILNFKSKKFEVKNVCTKLYHKKTAMNGGKKNFLFESSREEEKIYAERTSNNEELEKYKIEASKEKERMLSVINGLKKDVRVLQNENQNMQKKEKEKYEMNILKMQRQMNEAMRERDKWKNKSINLENKIRNMNLTKII